MEEHPSTAVDCWPNPVGDGSPVAVPASANTLANPLLPSDRAPSAPFADLGDGDEAHCPSGGSPSSLLAYFFLPIIFSDPLSSSPLSFAGPTERRPWLAMVLVQAAVAAVGFVASMFGSMLRWHRSSSPLLLFLCGGLVMVGGGLVMVVLQWWRAW